MELRIVASSYRLYSGSLLDVYHMKLYRQSIIVTFLQNPTCLQTSVYVESEFPINSFTHVNL